MNAYAINVSDAISVLNLLATAGIAVVVYLTSRRYSRLQVEREIRDAWITFDQLALESDGALERIDAVFHPDRADESPEAKYRRWVHYTVRNPLEMMFLTDTAGRFGARQPRAELATTLVPLVRDDAFMYIVRTYSDARFAAYCEHIRGLDA
jgi:hypothetical protein